MTKKQVLKHTVSYEEGLLKALKDPEEARAYLEVALDECEASGETDGLLLALRDKLGWVIQGCVPTISYDCASRITDQIYPTFRISTRRVRISQTRWSSKLVRPYALIFYLRTSADTTYTLNSEPASVPSLPSASLSVVRNRSPDRRRSCPRQNSAHRDVRDTTR